jgi:hypothetical protein
MCYLFSLCLTWVCKIQFPSLIFVSIFHCRRSAVLHTFDFGTRASFFLCSSVSEFRPVRHSILARMICVVLIFLPRSFHQPPLCCFAAAAFSLGGCLGKFPLYAFHFLVRCVSAPSARLASVLSVVASGVGFPSSVEWWAAGNPRSHFYLPRELVFWVVACLARIDLLSMLLSLPSSRRECPFGLRWLLPVWFRSKT